MRLVFMGTPEFAVRALAELVAAGHEIVCVYSQPPAPKGRGQVLSPSPVHAFAQSLGLEVRTPGSMKDPDAIAGFRALDIDAAVVVAYGQILKKEVLEHPPLGCFNLHAPGAAVGTRTPGAQFPADFEQEVLQAHRLKGGAGMVDRKALGDAGEIER